MEALFLTGKERATFPLHWMKALSGQPKSDKMLRGEYPRFASLKGRMECMSSTLHVPAAWLTMTAVATVFVIVCPFILGGIARNKLAVGWKYFWFGALVFLVSQLLTRLPLAIVLQNTVLAPLLRSSTAVTWAWLLILAVTAGLFEEVGRYVGYRLFMRREPKIWSKAVMFGLGHEGLESMVVLGVGHILTL